MGSFFALVGPVGAGKSSLLQYLKTTLPKGQHTFLCDSTGCGDTFAPHVQFAKKLTGIAQAHEHTDGPPKSQLLMFWARLNAIIAGDVVPALRVQKTVIMDGFGGTVFAHAMQAAHTEAERTALLALHLELIKHVVLGHGVPPPTYIWLRPSPAIAHKRLESLGKLSRGVTEETIASMNGWFEFYGKLHGQTVVPVNADQPLYDMFDEALRIIDPEQRYAEAA